MITELANKIWSRPEFQKEYQLLIQGALIKSLEINTNNDLNTDNIKRLLQCATTFAATSNPIYRNAAYKIAVSCLAIAEEEYNNIHEIVKVVFGRLGYFPSITLLEKIRKPYDDITSKDFMSQFRAPSGLWFEMLEHLERNSIEIGAKIKLALTDFQQNIWQKLKSGYSITLSAPTSAGKSFALQYFLIFELMSKADYKAVYIVPTRALINQISSNLSNIIKQLGINDAIVSTVPTPPEELGQSKIIYVLTQERLQILQDVKEGFDFNLIVVDESQMIEEGSRGVILHTVIENLLGSDNKKQIMFASPLTGNPEIFPDVFDLKKVEIIKEDETPVAQNIISLELDPYSHNKVKASVFLDNEFVYIGQKQLKNQLLGTESVLSGLAFEFGKSSKNIVYAGGQAKCEDIANMLVEIYDSRGLKNDNQDDEITEFSQFIKEFIHSKYLLASTINKGVAFHYGNMPTIVRKTIEDLFDRGKIDFLVCTSTLLHGVNLPATNLFMMNPTKGERIPISAFEFWNLAGRAGRLGKDFEGNIYLINLQKWEFNPLTKSKKITVKPSLYKNISENYSELIKFMNDEKHSSGKRENQAIENTFVKLYNEYKSNKIDKLFEKFNLQYDDETKLELNVEEKKEILDVLKKIDDKIKVPREILEKNISISPFRQQDMLEYLITKIKKEGPERVIPLHPLSSWDDTYNSILRLFKRIHTHFERKVGADRSHLHFAPLAIRWMRGDHLSSIIDNAYEEKKRKSKKKDPSIATVIREVMDNIEQDLRFRYVKYISCYNDLLQEALCRTDNEEYISSIPAIHLFLELGASSKTMVSLISCGLSRTTAKILNDKAQNKTMNRQEVLEWIKRQNLEGLNISPICIKEINRILNI